MQNKFEIIENLAMLPAYEKPGSGEKFHVEINRMSWYGNDPKIDIRSWNEDRSKMSKGAVLTEEEWDSLKNIIKSMEE